MAFIIITDSIENTINSLNSDLELNETVFKQTGKEVYKTKVDLLKGKLKAAIKYKDIQDRKPEFEKIKYLKHKDKDQYISRCMKIVKDMKGISFDKRTLLFKVQITRNKKRIYLGRFDSPQDSLEILQQYVSQG